MSYSKTLPVNTAIPFILNHKEKIPNYTLAHALSSGWMWQIPTQDRMGCGYVFCDKFISVEDAQKEVETVLGESIEPIKVIKFDAGRLEKFWYKNVLSVGLSSAFAEPLEATSIHTTICQLFVFLQRYWRYDKMIDNVTQEQYNNDMSLMYDDMKDFLSVHYLGRRHDTEFWKHIKENIELSDKVKKLLNHTKRHIPKFDYWEHYFGHVSSGLYNPILYNLGYLKPLIAKKELAKKNWIEDAKTFWDREKEFMDEHIPNLLDPNDLYNILNLEN